MIVHTVVAAAHYLAANPLNNVKPSNTGPNGTVLAGTNALSTIIGWAMWLTLIVAGLAAILSAGFAAWARVTARSAHFDRGVNAFLWSLGCAFLVGLAIPLINSFYNLSGGP